ncbi:MAG TPA: biotin carboxylase N-terminal domain-containing protein [Acidimicrobiia bacterium]
MPQMISKVLVANRGEIARRIFRTCRDMGISTVAVFSDADDGEPHVQEADEAVLLPGTSPAETYLNVEAVLAAAKETGADAIHPGYGFLSENAHFAREVGAAGLIWIGPSPESIELMGSKLESKRLMEEAGVPTLPSVDPEGLSTVGSAAMSLGFPVLVKASAGGGGKGMRIVDSDAELTDAVESARREAANAFGDDTVFLEKYLTAPRHIEIQVFGDGEGRVISLHERECSIQRRHQKIVEEAPSTALDAATRATMGQAAVAAANAVDYVGAGTVEFLYQDGSFYFLEMNTRLQVEHPVTEMITGLDLVRLQIEIAGGMPLPDKGPRIQGHAIEARLYAEDPLNDYLPVTGDIHRFEFPDLDGLRVDAGVAAGSTVSVHYDPMIAKVIAHAPTRQGAAALLASALRQARIHGSTTNRALLVRILEHPEFLSGETDTHFLQRNDGAELGTPLLDEPGERLAALAAAVADQAHERSDDGVLASIPSGWRNSPSQLQQRSYIGDHGEHRIGYSMTGLFPLDGVGTVTVDEATAGSVRLRVGDQESELEVSRYGDLRYVDSRIGPARLDVVPRFPSRDAEDQVGSLHAPMPGKVIKVEVSTGDSVGDGEVLVVMEAMKMEHTLRSPHAGEVTSVSCAAGDQVEAGEVLVVVEEAAS